MVHILPESIEQLEKYRKEPDGSIREGFPWPFLAAIASFSFVLMIDKIIFSHDQESDGKEIADTIRKSIVGGNLGGDQFLNPENPDYMEDNWKSVVGKRSQLALRASFYGKQSFRSKARKDSFVSKNNAKSVVGLGDEENNRLGKGRHPERPGGYGLQDPLVDGDAQNKLEDTDGYKASTKENNQITPETSVKNGGVKLNGRSIVDADQINEFVDEEKEESAPTKTCNLGPYVLALAMGIHAAFAGLALGLSRDFKGFFGLLVAILAHKWAEALTVGINFAKNIDDIGMKQAILLMGIFSFATPVGMAVGMALKNVNALWQSILFGVSAGTFIYISTTEIIVEEFSVTRYKWAKFFSYLVGIGLMVSIYFIEKATGG